MSPMSLKKEKTSFLIDGFLVSSFMLFIFARRKASSVICKSCSEMFGKILRETHTIETFLVKAYA